ncbi:MAG: aldehyde ferredoxin oxidoreductase [Desulfobacterales bacterium]|nr:aldehyde ferredoxin oxidoreductase [Desulfobacterales bacterium]
MTHGEKEGKNCFGYMGKVLWVNLTDGSMKEQEIDDKVYEEYLTGYGLASKLLFEKEVYKEDPLGPGNVFGVMSGLLTNTGAFFSGRWMVVGKSPLTGGWGDANCGGYFAPAIKNSGYDGILFEGRSEKPVYLLIGDGCKELRDARDLWGKDTTDTENILTGRHGANFKVACIGRGGEKLSRIAGVVTDKGRVAARSGLGCVMGSKNLKALCLGGREKTKIFDVIGVSRVTGDYMVDICNTNKNWINKIVTELATIPIFSGAIRLLNKYDLLSKIEPDNMDLYSMQRWGTCSTTALSANIGDSPVKNWKGVGCVDFPTEKARNISNDAITDHETEKYGCFHCPLRCGGKMNFPRDITCYPNPKKNDPNQFTTHKVEYETLCGFGTLVLCDNLAAVVEINEMLNRAGIDTISCAVVVAWAVEAFEKGVITAEDTEGLTLKWGDARAVKALVQKIIDCKGIGAILKDGVKRAAEHFKDGEAFAMHVGGQELPMHDPRQKGGTPLGVGYEVEPTPARHTSTCDDCSSFRSDGDPKNNKIRKLKGQLMQLKPVSESDEKAPDGVALRDASSMADLVNGLGLCLDAFGLCPTPIPLIEWINGATGWDHDFEYYLNNGRRIKTVRHCFNVMAGIQQKKTRAPDRARGYKIENGRKTPVLTEGPNANRIPDIDGGDRNYYQAMDWDFETGKPSDRILDYLGLDYVKKALKNV